MKKKKELKKNLPFFEKKKKQNKKSIKTCHFVDKKNIRSFCSFSSSHFCIIKIISTLDFTYTTGLNKSLTNYFVKLMIFWTTQPLTFDTFQSHDVLTNKTNTAYVSLEKGFLALFHSERPKLYTILSFLSAIGLEKLTLIISKLCH